MARVYLETSFFSACVSERTDAGSIYRRERSREWWATQRTRHALYISVEVALELGAPDFQKRELALSMLAGLEPLPPNPEVFGLSKVLVREKAMPGPEGKGDALHVAFAIVHGLEYLLTWNIRHLANANKMKHLQVICSRAGYLAPAILTPDLLLAEEST